MTGTVPALSLVFMVLSAMIGFAIPEAAFLYFRLKKRADILPFFIGCAVMFLFALVLEALIHQLVLGSAVGARIQANVWLYALYGGVMAGLFEETGRLLAFKTVLKKYQSRDVNALMYGAGHGGIEAAILLGVSMINNLIYSILINTGGIEKLIAPLPEAARAQMQTVVQALISTPSYQFALGGVERIFAVVLQISLSVLVWFAVKRAGWRWLFPLAIGLHAVVDALAGILSGCGVNLFLIEAAVCVMAALTALIARVVWNANAQKDAAPPAPQEVPADDA